MVIGSRAESAVLWFFSRDIGRAIYIQEVHVADERGACAGCCTQTAPTMHPCIVRQLADECISRLIPRPREATP
jgi:hypothetical protein